MDLIGEWATLCFPSVAWVFAGKFFSQLRDKELGLACMRAYNDWMLEAWCATAPDRFISCQVPWLATRRWLPKNCAGMPNVASNASVSPRTHTGRASPASTRPSGTRSLPSAKRLAPS